MSTKSKTKEDVAPFDRESFMIELSKLCIKYNLENCVFAGEYEDGKMMGFHCVERVSIGFNQKHLTNSVFNASRLYQSGREKILHMMDGK